MEAGVCCSKDGMCGDKWGSKRGRGGTWRVFEWKLMLWQRGKLPLVSLCAMSLEHGIHFTARGWLGCPSDQGRKHHRQNPLLLLPYNVDPLAAIAKGTFFITPWNR